jgi:pilus assembly protein CpaF
MTAPLFVTADETLLDELLRLAAAAGSTPEVAHDVPAALRGWLQAPLVLVGADLADAVGRAAPDRRDAVFVVLLGSSPDSVFQTALACGAESVAELPRSAGWLVERLTDVVDTGPARGLTIGVVGGSGGAGATTFACALGQVAGRTGAAVVVDADPLGPGADRVLGLDLVDGVRWDSLGHATGRLSARALRDSLPRRDGVAALSWYAGPQPRPLQAFAVREVLSASRRGHDLVVVDLPRGPDPLVEEITSRCDQLLVVVRPTVAGVSAAVRLCGKVRRSPASRAGRARPRGGGRCRVLADRRTGAGPDGRPAWPGRGDRPRVRAGPHPARSAREGGRCCARRPDGCAGDCGVTAVSDALVDEVRDRLAREPGPLTPHRVAEALRASGSPVGDATVLAVHETLRRDVVGAGPLEPLLRLEGVTDVLVNGPEQVFLDRGAGLERTEVTFPHDDAVRRLAQRLAAAGGRRLDDATPHVDVRLADGTRFHAVLAPLARPGTVLSLRIPRGRVLTLDELVESGTVTEHGARLLRTLVSRRLAFLVSGGTGSGKTTLLNSLLSLVPSDQRLVLVEDASELRPDHPHMVGLEARPANVEGAGEVGLRALVRQALRMRPDRLVVGEVRGAEVVELLAALNTGHEGGCGTIHANSARDVPARVEALALAAGLGREAAHSQFLAGVDAVLHLGRDHDGRRVLREVAVPTRRTDGTAEVRTAVGFPGSGASVTGPGEAELVERLCR